MRITKTAAPILITLGILAILPWVVNEYYAGLAVKIMIYGLFAMSLQLLVGGAGLISLGHAAFFGAGAYATALLAPESGAGNFFFLVPSVLAAAMAYAAITGALSLRTRGIYFIMITLAFAQMAYYVFHDTQFGGGSDGIYLYFRPEWRLGDWTLLNIDEPRAFYLFVLSTLGLVWIFLTVLGGSRFGAALNGIRINEQRMRAAGYSTFAYKFVAYLLAAGLAGIAGMLHATKDGFINPELLNWEQSGLVLLMVIMGGSGRLWGALLGALCLILLEELFQSEALFGALAGHWHLTFGLTIIVLVALLPQGLAGLSHRPRKRRKTPALSEPTSSYTPQP
ncbi:MAG: branched-chain amino acid ABC transporter permease [Castellaniella sp.]|nr:branched-chain amino acid ABC transporter permease [Castellaniella sp.]